VFKHGVLANHHIALRQSGAYISVHYHSARPRNDAHAVAAGRAQIVMNADLKIVQNAKIGAAAASEQYRRHTAPRLHLSSGVGFLGGIGSASPSSSASTAPGSAPALFSQVY
jgi:hypothetical protein